MNSLAGSKRHVGNRLSLAILLVTLAFALAPAATAQIVPVAPPCNETNLQNAINAVEPGGGTVTFTNCGGPVTIVLSSPLTIDAPGAGIVIDATGQNVTLSGGGSVQIMQVGLVAVGPVTLNNLTFLNGSSTGANLGGGAIYTGGTLTVNNSTFTGNTVAGFRGGGAIQNFAGTLTVNNSTFSGNSSASVGGAIDNESGEGGGILTVTNSTFTGNSTNGGASSGGAIENNGGTATVSFSTFTGNSALSGSDTTYGGAIDNDEGTLTVSNSTFSGNTASSSNGIASGGAIENDFGTVTVDGATFSGNTNVSGSATTGFGGAIDNEGGPLTVTCSTFFGNTTTGVGGAINNAGSGTVTATFVTFSANGAAGGGGDLYNNDGNTSLLSTIVAAATSGSNCVINSGTITDGGYNLDDGTTCGFSSLAQSLSNTNPQLGPLANNGGPTKTLALLATSPAIDKIPPGVNGCGTNFPDDQRGVPRPQGVGCDIGAYEVAGLRVPSPSLTFTSVFGGAAPAPQTLSVSTSGFSVPFSAVTTTIPAGGSWLAAAVAPPGTTPGSIIVTITPAGLAVGVHTGQITISTSADAIASLIVPVTYTVTQPSISSVPSDVLTLSSSANPSSIAQSVTFTASLTVTNGIGPPNGTVQFSDGGKILGSPVPVSGAQASFTTSSLALGSHTINASYSGDSQYPASGASFGQVVNRLFTVLLLSSSVTGQGVTLTAQMGPPPPAGLPGPTGQVTFSEGANQLGAVFVSNAVGVLQLATLSAGTHQITAVYSGDADWSSARGTTTVTVTVPALTILTASLPPGTATVAYTAPPMSASGGVLPLQWSLTQTVPSGIALAGNGTFSGTPPAPGTFTLTVQVTDAHGTQVSKQFTVKVAAAPLSITTQTLPGGTTGSPYTAAVAASGGASPYTFSGSLPANLTIDPESGAISGTPIVNGAATLTINVKDSTGTTASKTYTVAFALPAVPPLTISSGGGSTGPDAQPALQVNLGAGFPVAITGTLTLTFQAASNGKDNPEVQFSTGGRTVSFTIPANSTAPIPIPQLQTGTVAGVITITADLKVSSTDVTPAPAPVQQITINAVPPTILSATASTNASGFTVTVTGFSTTLDMTQAVFQFNAASGANLQTTSLTIQVGTLFSSYYQANTPGPTGSQFTYVQPFTVSGSATITSVTVTMVNSSGSSQTATATIQ
jgi:hypothetical protein